MVGIGQFAAVVLSRVKRAFVQRKTAEHHQNTFLLQMRNQRGPLRQEAAALLRECAIAGNLARLRRADHVLRFTTRKEGLLMRFESYPFPQQLISRINYFRDLKSKLNSLLGIKSRVTRRLIVGV